MASTSPSTETFDLQACRQAALWAIEERNAAPGVILTPELRAILEPRPPEKGVSGGWQAGKSISGGLEMYLKDLMLPMRIAHGDLDWDTQQLRWMVLPSYRSPHKEWDYLKNWHQQAGSFVYSREPADGAREMWVCDGRVKYETRTGHDIPAIAGEPCDDLMVVEAGQIAGSVLEQARGRLMTRGGDLTLNGTVEDVTGKPQWAWYPKLLKAWEEIEDGIHLALRLPSWANPVAFPGGRQDPKILRAEEDNPPFIFRRRYGGEPLGHQFPLYPEFSHGSWEEQREKWHYDCTDERVWVRELGVGGHDYGKTYGHESTLVPMTMTRDGILVVRTSWHELTDNPQYIENVRALFSQRFGIPNNRWGFDPMQQYAAGHVGAAVMDAETDDARMIKVGKVRRRIEATPRAIRFDFDNEGALEVFREMQNIHLTLRFLATQGEKYSYNRVDDNLAAAAEYAVFVADENLEQDIRTFVENMVAERDEATRDPQALRRTPQPKTTAVTDQVSVRKTRKTRAAKPTKRIVRSSRI